MGTGKVGDVDWSYSDSPPVPRLVWHVNLDRSVANLQHKAIPQDGEWIQNDSLNPYHHVDLTDHTGVTHRLSSGSRILANNGVWVRAMAKGTPVQAAGSLLAANNHNVYIRYSPSGLVTDFTASTADCWVLQECNNSKPGEVVEVDAGEVIIRGPGYIVSLLAGESAEFVGYPAGWVKAKAYTILANYNNSQPGVPTNVTNPIYLSGLNQQASRQPSRSSVCPCGIARMDCDYHK